MSIFSKHTYIKLEIPSWTEVRLFDPRSSKMDMQVGLGWVGRISEQDLDQIKGLLAAPHVDRFLRPLMDVVTLLDRQAGDQVLALGFANGWLVADLEAEAGIAKRGRASGAALIAISMLRGSFAEQNTLTLANMLDAGYFANRTDLDPLAFMLKVVEGSGVRVSEQSEPE